MVGQTLAHYRILEKIGSGGMGDVYLAEDTKLGRKVALKVLPPELAESEERRARFKREAKALAALDHPNIVQVFSVEEAEGIHFITMQLVHGKTLTELLPKNGFPLNKFFDILVEQQDVHDPRWSPDGEWLTFSSFGVHVPPRIWLMHRSETKPDVLVTGQRHPEWSPDGKHVFFTREVVGGVTSAIGRGELWAVDLESRSERQLTDLSGRTGRFEDLATDGAYLYFTWEEGLGDIWVMDVVRKDQ